MFTESKQSSFKESIKVKENKWLQHYKEGNEFSETEIQEILGDIWQILSDLYPLGRTGETGLKVPSAKLVELDLVSEKAAEEIGERRIRKTNGFEQIKPEDEPLNIVRIDRTPEGFLISKTYISEEQHLVIKKAGGTKEEGEELRKDTMVEEESLLIKEGDSFKLTMRQNKAGIKKEAEALPKVNLPGVHLHGFGETWFPKDLTDKSQFQEVEVTSKDLVRTLVLLVEGIY